MESPCDSVISNKEYKGCPSGQFCNLDTRKCVSKDPGKVVRANVNGFNVYGSAAAVDTFLKKVNKNAKNPVIENLTEDQLKNSDGHALVITLQIPDSGRAVSLARSKPSK